MPRKQSSKAVTREKVKRISQGRRNAMKPQELPLPKVEDALEATITMSSTALSVESTSGRRRGAASEAYTGRLSHDAYKVLRAFFRDVTSNPTLAQCNELSYKIQQLSGCEACTCEKIRQYFANRKRNLARRTSTVLGVDTIPLGVEEDSKEGILTPKEVFQVSAHAPAASGIAHENSTAQKTEALVQATNSLSADVQRGPSGTHVPQYPSQACTAGKGGVPVTHAAEFHVWYIGYPSSPAPSTDLYAQSDLRFAMQPVSSQLPRSAYCMAPGAPIVTKTLIPSDAAGVTPMETVQVGTLPGNSTFPPAPPDWIRCLATEIHHTLTADTAIHPDVVPKTFSELSRWFTGSCSHYLSRASTTHL